MSSKQEPSRNAEAGARPARWLLLIHQIPPKPSYLRVKVWRRLQRLGAVALKNSVYVLPVSEQASEDFEWVAREVSKQGGEAAICEARFVEGVSDADIEALFQSARDSDYVRVAEDARKLATGARGRNAKDGERARLEADVARLRARFAEIHAIDFFGAPQRETTDGVLAGLERRTRGSVERPSESATEEPRPNGATWVTRRGIHVDRMASAWLIRRFIDESARFKFVAQKGYVPKRGELRFDMFEGEYTHEDELCTFEVLLSRFGLADAALRALAEIVHDIDLKDAKFERKETAGVDQVLASIASTHDDDETRLSRASAVLDDLYAHFGREARSNARD